MALYLQSATYTRLFKMIDSSDHISKKTGLSPTVNISKAGAAFGAAAGTVTEVANGWYKVALTTADTGTLGDLAFYITAAAADDTDFSDQVVAYDPLTAPATAPTNWSSMVIDGSGRVDVSKVGGTTQTARDLGASVLLSSGTGTGQVSLSSGTVTVGTNNDKTGYSLSQSFPANFSSLGISAGGHISNVDVLTTYTGDTPQSGDCFARIGATGSGLSSLAQASTALSNANWTNGRAANLDNLDRAITAIMTTALTESARALRAMPTPSQALQEILQNIVASSFSGLTKTAHKLSDGTTPTKTYTVDANPPTAIVEAS